MLRDESQFSAIITRWPSAGPCRGKFIAKEIGRSTAVFFLFCERLKLSLGGSAEVLRVTQTVLGRNKGPSMIRRTVVT